MGRNGSCDEESIHIRDDLGTIRLMQQVGNALGWVTAAMTDREVSWISLISWVSSLSQSSLAEGAALVVGGPGDLEHVTAVLHTVTVCLFRLDEGVNLHRVSLAKKGAARFNRSTSA